MIGYPLHKQWFAAGILIGVAIFVVKFLITRSA